MLTRLPFLLATLFAALLAATPGPAKAAPTSATVSFVETTQPDDSSQPVTAIALVGILSGGFLFLFFTLRAMLGLTTV